MIKVDRKVFGWLVESAKKHGATKFVVYDTEGCVGCGTDVDNIFTLLDGGDEMVAIEFERYEEKFLESFVVGTFQCHPFEGDRYGEIIWDWTDNKFCEDVMMSFESKEFFDYQPKGE